MPEDEKGTEGEDLFEDLDKFFAPIQDVDWPESSEGTGSGTTQAADRSQRARAGGAQATGARAARA